MTGDLENEAALDHPGNAVVKPLTVGFDPWEAHELGGDDNTTNTNSVTINHIELGIISTFRPVPLRPHVLCFKLRVFYDLIQRFFVFGLRIDTAFFDAVSKGSDKPQLDQIVNGCPEEQICEDDQNEAKNTEHSRAASADAA